jgi:hypothetical protein
MKASESLAGGRYESAIYPLEWMEICCLHLWQVPPEPLETDSLHRYHPQPPVLVAVPVGTEWVGRSRQSSSSARWTTTLPHGARHGFMGRPRPCNVTPATYAPCPIACALRWYLDGDPVAQRTVLFRRLTTSPEDGSFSRRASTNMHASGLSCSVRTSLTSCPCPYIWPGGSCAPVPLLRHLHRTGWSRGTCEMPTDTFLLGLLFALEFKDPYGVDANGLPLHGTSMSGRCTWAFGASRRPPEQSPAR